jgi:hypothetical protein
LNRVIPLQPGSEICKVPPYHKKGGITPQKKGGLSEKGIAKEMGIALSTLNEWSKKYPEFSDALSEGKSEADAAIENALYKRATGYEYELSFCKKCRFQQPGVSRLTSQEPISLNINP